MVARWCGLCCERERSKGGSADNVSPSSSGRTYKITDAGCVALVAALDSGALPALVTLHLDGIPASAAAIATVYEARANLKDGLESESEHAESGSESEQDEEGEDDSDNEEEDD